MENLHNKIIAQIGTHTRTHSNLQLKAHDSCWQIPCIDVNVCAYGCDMGAQMKRASAYLNLIRLFVYSSLNLHIFQQILGVVLSANAIRI